MKLNKNENSADLSFQNLGLDKPILKMLGRHKFKIPTDIQSKAIPDALKGEDIIGVAQTGTGKTLAFCLPVIQRLIRHGGKALVLAPTRELAMQIEDSFHKMGGSFGVRTALLIGGVPIRKQRWVLEKNPHVIVGTPGRVINHLEDKTLPIKQIRILVLDEADQMFDMGFAPQIKKVIKAIPEDRQTLLFSATMPKEIVEIATKYMKKPTHIEVAKQGTTSKNVSQEIFLVKRDQKFELLLSILNDNKGSVILFSRTKFGAKRICDKLNRGKVSAAEIHSNRTLEQRRRALSGFKKGRYRVLVATDIAARGIDVKEVSLVINFDAPEYAEDYVHRIGRTGRAGNQGRALTFLMPNEKNKLKKIERLIQSKIPQSELPGEIEKVEFDEKDNKGGFRRRKQRQKKSSGFNPKKKRFNKSRFKKKRQ